MEDITDFSANIAVFEKSSRDDADSRLVTEYKLSMKLIENRVNTRIDYPEAEGSYRTVISTPTDTLMFDRKSHDIYARIENDISESYQAISLFNRIDLENLKGQMYDLSYRVSETDEGRLEFFAPDYVLEDISGDDYIVKSQSIYFDKDLEAPVEVHTFEYDSVNGCNIERIEETFYQEVNDLPVVVGKCETIHYDFGYKIDVSDRLIPELTADTEAPIITETELDTLNEQGYVPFFFKPIYGDPSDPNYTLSTLTVYSDLDLGELDDELFRTNL